MEKTISLIARIIVNISYIIENLFLSITFKKIKTDIVILDSYFPVLSSSFLTTEINEYINFFKNVVVFSDSKSRILSVKKYTSLYPNTKKNIKFFNKNILIDGKICYVIFLQNAYHFIDYIEANQIYFILELYPGGNFGINDYKSDIMMKRVLGSKFLKKCICTMNITYKYILEKKFCEKEKLIYIYGCILPINYFKNSLRERNYYGNGKKHMDICFVANKYSPQGKDKGYDVFINVAKKIILDYKCDNISFHVVGGFNKDDIDITTIGKNITFYGYLKTEDFTNFYSNMDIFLSINRPGALIKGSFDGFPTGCCIEASACGVVLYCSDFLHLNTEYNDGKDILIARNDNINQISKRIFDFYNNSEKLKNIGKSGQLKTHEIFDQNVQMSKRINLIKQYL